VLTVARLMSRPSDTLSGSFGRPVGRSHSPLASVHYRVSSNMSVSIDILVDAASSFDIPRSVVDELEFTGVKPPSDVSVFPAVEYRGKVYIHMNTIIRAMGFTKGETAMGISKRQIPTVVKNYDAAMEEWKASDDNTTRHG
jgi:hypothetical protein